MKWLNEFLSENEKRGSDKSDKRVSKTLYRPKVTFASLVRYFNEDSVSSCVIWDSAGGVA
jgi:hypothetical protein